MRALWLAALVAACTARRPAYPVTAPPPLPPAAAPLDPREVLLSFAPFRWHDTAGSSAEFPVTLSLDQGEIPRIPGRLLGMLRSQLRSVDANDRYALFCEWGPGDCAVSDASAQRARAHVIAVVDGLRAEAARVGASDVRAIRCFVRAGGQGGLLWCEGRGTTGRRDPKWLPTPEPEIIARAVIAPSRWRLGATFTTGRYGQRFVVGTTLDLTYRGVKTAFHMVSPTDQRSAALGFDLLLRHRVGGRQTLFGGASAMLLAPLSRGGTVDNAGTAGAVGPVLGFGLETESFALFKGFGKPFAELRAGYLFAPAGQELAGPNVELVFGLVTP